ncbi:hypothetical protein D3C75_1109880 [compost metagenome]
MPSAFKAAVCITGDLEWAMGSPITPSSISLFQYWPFALVTAYSPSLGQISDGRVRTLMPFGT